MENKKKKYAKEIEQIRRESGAKPELCMVCGKCSGSCPAFDEMEVHPHQFAQMILRGELDELMNSRGIYKCMSCFTCSERCPRGVEPAKLVEAVRIAVIRRCKPHEAGGCPREARSRASSAGDSQRVPQIREVNLRPLGRQSR